MKSQHLPLYPRLCSLAAVVMLTSCGVPKVDYEALQKENQELQKVIDRGNQSFRQLQAQFEHAQKGLAAITTVEKRIKELERELADKNQELQQLEETFEKFKKDRRNGMLGKDIPILRLDNGRTLKNVRITAFKDDELSLRHDDGFLKVALAETSQDLRWEACFDPAENEAAKRRRVLATAKALSNALDQKRLMDPSAEIVRSNNDEAKRVRAAIDQQRAALNRAHDDMAARNPSAFKGAHWNSSRPEDSGLINVFSERRAILGISALDNMAAGIKANLEKLRGLEGGGSR
jgi:chromosome segregation ATPase